ncbi:MAG: sensor histidine kinase [Luteolibacter sp.]
MVNFSSSSKKASPLLILTMVIGLGSILHGETALVNPIGKVARLFNPRLVNLEGRVAYLESQLQTLAVSKSHDLRGVVGYRGMRVGTDGKDPQVTLDLGSEFSVDELFLVPLQKSIEERNELFPTYFRVEVSKSADFSEVEVLYKGGGLFGVNTGKPLLCVAGRDIKARYVRLVVERGNVRGQDEVFGLSEIVVISSGYPVSFGCEIIADESLSVKGMWSAKGLVDSRMPLGVWQGSYWSQADEYGDLVGVSGEFAEVSWTLDLAENEGIDYLTIFPVDVPSALESGILPEELEVQVRFDGQEEFETVAKWNSPNAGAGEETPLMLEMGGQKSGELRLVGTRARKVGAEFFQGMSEIEVWSSGRNLAAGATVLREVEGGREEVDSLTNGFASEKEIIPVAEWLKQINERWKVEREVESLLPVHREMASESELNATWGSAVILGLTFLIPVFIVERRRLISKEQMEVLRKRIASDLHDDIGSNLGSISLIARTARKDLARLQGPSDVGNDLGEMENIAMESSLAMRDIVWLLERNQDSIGDLVSRMQETAERILRGVQYDILCDSAKTTAKLSLDAKRHLFLFFKESIYNVVKHSGATKVMIRLSDKGETMVLEVSDNGSGLPVGKENEKPKPVRKLQDRAKFLEGALDILSDAGVGTKILLSVKRANIIAEATI